ncbi:MAG TPA: 16S rRNA (guanine(966)-N(2))-methyltransferase RsmD [Polyangia bacterium]|nr:16S rRNA (guanine(966)-N(2))-methyltransferase RsmD [Polyangia bacterium]
MRIIAGAFGGRRLVTPRGLATRPTADRVKEAIFNILGPPRAENGAAVPFRVLDLYAGSGALGLEAISRGADEAVLVETDRPAIQAATRNVAALGLEARVRIVQGDAAVVLRRLPGPFSWVFLDPPYGMGAIERVLRLLGDGVLLTPGAVVLAEHDAREAPADRHGRLALEERRRYGQTAVSFYRLAATEPEPEPEENPR